MMLKLSSGYLDFNGPVEMERQVKLLEEIDATYGDFSYSFELQWTQNNLDKLGFPYPDVVNKTIYSNVDCDLLDDEGHLLHKGLLRLQSYDVGKSLQCSFFSGNYNWMNLITGDLSELDFSNLDVDLEYNSVIALFNAESNLVFPFLDIGGLVSRSEPILVMQDFNGCMYVKTIFNKLFNTVGIKIKGDLINDWVYNNAVVCKNNKNSEGIAARTTYAKKTSNQTVVDGAAFATIAFQDDSTYPYFDGDQNNYNNGTYIYTADIKMNIKLDVSLIISMNTQLNTMYFRVNKNGAAFKDYSITHINPPSPPTSYNISLVMSLNAGDTLKIEVRSNDALNVNTGVQTGSTIRITPLFVFKVFGNSAVPNWTKQDFVSNVLNLFNVITDFDPFTKELTFDLFDKIKTKQPIDISEHVKVTNVDFEEFISNFGRNNTFSYEQSDDDSLKEYNIKQFVKYGEGVINVDNDFIEENVPIIQSDFSSPTSYINGIFSTSLEKINFIEYEEGDEATFGSVSNSSNKARFNISANVFVVGDLVRVMDSTHAAYNGDFVVSAQGSGYIEFYTLTYDISASGTIKKLNVVYTNDDNVFLLINIPEILVSDISGLSTIGITDGTVDGDLQSIAYAYFNILDTDRNVNDNYKQSLSFGAIDDVLFYQKTLLDTYWRNVASMLNDPVKVLGISYLPKSVYLSLSPLFPVTIKTNETTNMYYINRITGYQKQNVPCDLNLIKLS